MPYVAQMLHSFSTKLETPPIPTKRNTEKARAARQEKVRKWFLDNMKAESWDTTTIASKRGQENSSCLPLLYDLEKEGFLTRAGFGPRKGRGRCPVIWKLTNPPPSS
jgi:hypothetical protein